MNTPKIEPIKMKEYTVKQSNYGIVGTLPIRSVILGPSGSGKTVLLQNMILEIYKIVLKGFIYSVFQYMLIAHGCL